MSLSKQQMIGAVGAGVFVLCAGGLGFMLYSAWTERGEAEETLQGHTDNFNRYHAAPVFPSTASIEAVKSNGVSYAAWHTAASAFAARGDRKFDDETPSAFKQRLQGEVRRMASLEGGVEGRICAPSFLFGFEQYLGEGGVLPQSGDVPKLAVQLDTISRVVDLFAEAGVLEVKAIKRVEDKAGEDEEESSGNARGRKKGGDEGADAPKETCLKYAFEFTTRPAALVDTLNRLTSCERFAAVKGLSFKQTADMIVDRLGAIANAEAQKSAGRMGGGRRGRRGAAQVDAKTGEVQVDPLIVDPELDAPILVSFSLEVRDFGRAPEKAAPAAAAEGDKPAEEAKPVEKKEGKE